MWENEKYSSVWSGIGDNGDHNMEKGEDHALNSAEDGIEAYGGAE